MRKILRALVVLWIGSSSLVFAQDHTLTTPFFHKNDLSLSIDTQWIDGIRELKTAAIESSSNLTQFFLGAEYVFSELSSVRVRFPLVFHQFTAKYNFPGLTSSSYRSQNWYTDRLRAGIEGKLFLETLLGQISWYTTGYFPTMDGYQTVEHHFFNHTDLRLGLKNMYPFPKSQAFILGDTSYIIKFTKKYGAEKRDYGDEVFNSLGMGYVISSAITPVVQLQYSYVFPLKKTIANIEKKSEKGASAVHLSPSFSIPIQKNVVIRTNSRILLHRDKINGKDAAYLWGNFEDEGDFTIQVGLRIGIL